MSMKHKLAYPVQRLSRIQQLTLNTCRLITSLVHATRQDDLAYDILDTAFPALERAGR